MYRYYDKRVCKVYDGDPKHESSFIALAYQMVSYKGVGPSMHWRAIDCQRTKHSEWMEIR